MWVQVAIVETGALLVKPPNFCLALQQEKKAVEDGLVFVDACYEKELSVIFVVLLYVNFSVWEQSPALTIYFINPSPQK